MTRGHRPASNSNMTTSANSATATSSSSSITFQQQQTPRRGNKTLGWYLGDKLNGSSANEGDNSGGGEFSSASNGQMAPQSRADMIQQRRRGSLADTAASNCSKTLGKLADEQQQNSTKVGKKNLQQQKQSVANTNNHRPRANSSSANAASKKAGSTTTQAQSNGQFGTTSDSANDLAKHTTAAVATQQRIGKGPNSGKEDYWYYDEVSDGFYYEHNGTRGWRKRRPEWGTVEQMKGMIGTEHSPKRTTEQQQLMLLQQQLLQKQKTLEAKTSGVTCPTVPSLLAPQQLSKFAAQHLPHEHLLSPTPAHFKYYDPTTDGFYYEMASFDGWKRRQPQLGVSTVDGTSPPQGTLSPSPLYCSPLLGGNGGGDLQTTNAQQQWQCASPGPNQQKQQAPHRKVQPLHYQAYQQPAPHLNSKELQERILLAQQNQHHLRCATNSVSSCAQLNCYPKLAGNGTTACCCTNIAAMVTQLMKQQKLTGQMECHQQNNSADNNNSLNKGSATELNKLSSADNIRSLLDMEQMRPAVVRSTHEQQINNNGINSLNLPRNKWEHHQLGGIVPSPPPLLPSLQRNNERRSSNIITAVNTNNDTNVTATKTNTALSIGSFEEPYEFYWSGDEASSEMVSLATPIAGNQQQNEQKMMEIKNEDQSVAQPFTMSTTTTTAASVSSIEEDDMDGCGMLDQYMAEMMGTVRNGEKQRKIAPIGSEANHLGNKKRPNTLKLDCPKSVPIISNGNVTNGLSAAYEPISPGEILCDDEQQVEYNDNSDSKKEFNVDKFINDVLLTPYSKQQSLLYDPNSSSNILFTPLTQQADVDRYAVKDPWYYNKSSDISTGNALQQHQQLMDSANPWAYP